MHIKMRYAESPASDCSPRQQHCFVMTSSTGAQAVCIAHCINMKALKNFRSLTQTLEIGQKYLWLFLLRHSIEDQFYNIRHKNLLDTENCYPSQLIQQHVISQHQTWMQSLIILPRGAACTCSSLTADPSIASQDYLFHSPQKSQTKRKEKKCNGEAVEDRLFWYTKLSSTQHRDRGKTLEYLRAKGGPSPRSQLACSYLNSLESPFRHRLQISQLHYLCHWSEPRQGGHTMQHLSSSIISWERGRTWSHLPVSIVISSWFAHLGMLTSLKNKAKMALYC